MKDFKFYAELPDDGRQSKSGSKHYYAFTRAHLQDKADRGLRNNCIAIPLENGRPVYQGSTLNFDAFGVVLNNIPRSVEGCSSNQGYLRAKCVRISEELARCLHPNLFLYLEADHG